MTIPGTLEQWRSWTGLPFAESGDVEVPGALVPVHVDVEADHAVYVEPTSGCTTSSPEGRVPHLATT
jgi:hypothetical protein